MSGTGRPAGGNSVTDSVMILVVEDDELVRDLVKDALAEAGFETAIVTTGEEAVGLLKGGKSPYRALVTDINLQGRIDGWEIARVARERDPAFPIVYMTGAAGDEWASQGVPNSILLNKPFAPAQLVIAVANLLNSAPITG